MGKYGNSQFPIHVSVLKMKFIYTALTKEGTKESGTLEAKSQEAAGHELKARGLIPTELHPQNNYSFAAFVSAFSSVKLADKIVFIEDLSVMLKSGIPVSRSLDILVKQTKNRKFMKTLIELHQAVENGTSLHEAMAVYPQVFSEIFVSMIKVGELSGNLDQSLDYLRTQLEREADLKSHVRGAMIYPSVIVVTMVIIAIVMSIFVLPKLTSVFKEFGAQLPFATRVVIFISDFMAGNALVVIVGILLAVAGLVAGLRTQAGKRVLYAVVLRMPILNPVIKKISLARFTRILGSLLKSGIPIVESLKVSGESSPNPFYREALLATAEEVKVGQPLTHSLGQNTLLFPVLVVQMLEVGEETGSLEAILGQLAVHFEAEVDATLKNFSSIIEPLLLLVIGGVVGALAYALIIPIYSIGNAIQ